MFMPIEMEAYLNQDDWDYCMHGATRQWKLLETLTLKDKRRLAKEYYGSKPKPYITRFLHIKLTELNKIV